MMKLAFAICSAMLWFAVLAQAQGQPTSCSPEEVLNPIRPSDPSYSDAIELAASLRNHHGMIRCVGPSKFEQFLPRQTGAALFPTTRGDFEALFRPKEQNFDDIFIQKKEMKVCRQLPTIPDTGIFSAIVRAKKFGLWKVVKRSS